MSYINFEGGKFFFYDAADKKILLADVVTSAENRSKFHSHQFISARGDVYYPLLEEIYKHLNKIFDGSNDSMIRLLIFLRLTAELLRKQQIQKVLCVGEWSELNSSLARFLPQFNAENFLYNFAKSKPIEKFNNVKFIFADEDDCLLVENKFSTIILSQPLLQIEMFFSVKDFGKIFFAANKSGVPPVILQSSKVYDLTEYFSVFELTITPELKNFLRPSTLSGLLSQKKFSIRQVVEKFPEVIDKVTSLSGNEKKYVLDQYISELGKVEKVLNEIFINLHSDTVKHNFNVLKEFLIDYRLFGGGEEKIFAKYNILTEDMQKDF